MIKFTDRYEALGIPLPVPGEVCLGGCEGCGVYPEKAHKSNKPTQFAEVGEPEDKDCQRYAPEACDGWHFITCAACGGTGKRPR